jgi:hypothetical protein
MQDHRKQHQKTLKHYDYLLSMTGSVTLEPDLRGISDFDLHNNHFSQGVLVPFDLLAATDLRWIEPE